MRKSRKPILSNKHYLFYKMSGNLSTCQNSLHIVFVIFCVLDKNDIPFAVIVIVIHGGDVMPRKGENLYKRKDGRWVGGDVKDHDCKKRYTDMYIHNHTLR